MVTRRQTAATKRIGISKLQPFMDQQGGRTRPPSQGSTKIGASKTQAFTIGVSSSKKIEINNFARQRIESNDDNCQLPIRRAEEFVNEQYALGHDMLELGETPLHPGTLEAISKLRGNSMRRRC